MLPGATPGISARYLNKLLDDGVHLLFIDRVAEEFVSVRRTPFGAGMT
jgi:hypothetical protein